jgi:hypothetical protein
MSTGDTQGSRQASGPAGAALAAATPSAAAVAVGDHQRLAPHATERSFLWPQLEDAKAVTAAPIGGYSRARSRPAPITIRDHLTDAA